MTSGRFHLNGSNNEENHSTHRRNSTTDSTPVDATTTTATTTTATASSNSLTAAEATATTTNNGISEHIRKFVFSSNCIRERTQSTDKVVDGSDEEIVEKLEIKIPELLQGGYSFYTWPSAPVLSWFLWDRRRDLIGKRILELGAGTALPGILAAKCGANVILTDNCILPKSLAHIRKSCLANELVPGRDIQIIGLSWGLLLNSVFNLSAIDLIIAADCFYDPTVFEDIIVSVAFLLERNPGAKFIFTYQERSADWSIEALLKKWKLCALQINIDDIGKSAEGAGIDILELMGGHTIHLIEITKNHL